MSINNQSLKFLKDIQKNNNKIWFDAHKADFTAAVEDFKTLCKGIEDGLNKTDQIDTVKIFRIYRDIRFSADKTPYKSNFGAGFSRATSQLRGGYYLHIEPGASFAGGGFWDPEAMDLKRIRDEISMDPGPMRAIQSSKTFKKYFGQIEGDQVKTMPRGYDTAHPAADLIRHKQFVVRRKFTDAEITSPRFAEEVIQTFKALRPFFDYMSEVLTTDNNGEPLKK
ncbi:MAG: DUF2461 domain-containing protein [Saprospiraceae bacterium]|nr:DUF2461 domain-containing protein [Saprospiraceae bacterium]